jgi:hypothetical protein
VQHNHRAILNDSEPSQNVEFARLRELSEETLAKLAGEP